MPENVDGLDVTAALNYLGNQGYHQLWLECGPRFANSCFKQKLLNQCYIYIAPQFLGKQGLAYDFEAEKFVLHAKQVKWSTFDEDACLEILF